MNVMNHLRSVFVGLAVGVVLDAGVLATAPDYYPPEVRSEAKNPAVMYLFPDAGKLQGWVGGEVNVCLKDVAIDLDLVLRVVFF